MIKNNLTIFGVMIVFAIGCNAKQEIDLILHNAKVYTVDSAFSIGEAIAIDNGYIVGTGTSEQILRSYQTHQSIKLLVLWELFHDPVNRQNSMGSAFPTRPDLVRIL